MRKIIGGFFILAALTGCSDSGTTETQPLPRVKVKKAITKTVPYVVRGVGNVQAKVSVQVRPLVTGQIVGIHFEDGQEVKVGDPLFTIDPRKYAAELEQAQGMKEQAEASLKYNEDKVKRYKKLLPEEFVSQLDYDQYVSNVAEAKGQVKEYEGKIQEAQVNLDYCHITSPIDGRCGKEQYWIGNIVKANQDDALVTVNQIVPTYVLFNLSESSLYDILKHQKEHSLSVLAYPKVGAEAEQGTLEFIDNQVSTATGTVQMRAKFSNEDRMLWPGQFVQIEVVLYEIPDAVLIPTSAVQRDSKGPYVFIAKKNQTADLRRVELGQQHGDLYVVDKGVSAEERVVVDGQLSLSQGSKFTEGGSKS